MPRQRPSNWRARTQAINIPLRSYETSNGISRTETGEVKPGAGEEDGSLSVQGSTSWSAPDGKKYEISFTADETGYHPKFRLVA
ncbi:endocuticle structural glycoprotein ABD-5 isoform X2 [Drosophila mauritiana]|uniref:Endocuticle structural glycoprotein ABD-5 isoform X2 n=1 Tax=Drosophila mauritiana TaxID=7226 RepID=A0A6P8JV02_DROMA|nr:endocuticle structural glycoprotein ABD-5 isoform X2 [Drosophila mauritiana]